jgi:hypothetical protein
MKQGSVLTLEIWKWAGNRHGDGNKRGIQLVGGLEHEFYFPIQLGIIIPTDFCIFQRG